MESKVPNSFEVETFYPNEEEFKCFGEYVRGIRKKCLNSLAAKVIPPASFQNVSRTVRGTYMLKNVVEQTLAPNSNKTAFEILTAPKKSRGTKKKKIETLSEFIEEAQKFERNLSIEEYEDHFWRRMKLGKAKTAIPSYPYAVDNDLSLFDRNCRSWNLSNLTYADSIIHEDVGLMIGIQTPYTYFGMANTMFGYHLEDGDLCSISYLHSGKPKVWYVVPDEDGDKLAQLVQVLIKNTGCNLYIRHKNVMISPSVLAANNIRFARVVQNPNEFIILFSGCYHSGFNCGINAAEAVNFATPEWLTNFKIFRICSCGHNENPVKVQSFLEGIYDKEFIKANKPSETFDRLPNEEQGTSNEVLNESPIPEMHTKRRKTATNSVKPKKVPVKPKKVLVKPKKVPVKPKKVLVKPKQVPSKSKKVPVKPKQVPAKSKKVPAKRNPKGHQCDQCPKTYGLKKNLLYHQRKMHSQFIEKYVCRECEGVTYIDPWLLKRHLKERHEKIVEIANLAESRIHVRNTKGIKAAYKHKLENPTKRKIMTCDKCGITCAGSFNLKRHHQNNCPISNVYVPAQEPPYCAPNVEQENSVQNYQQAECIIKWKKRLALSWEHDVMSDL